MKNIIIASIVVAAAGLTVFSLITKQTAEKSEPEVKINNLEINRQQENLRQAILKIDGMFCVSCATGAEYALKEKEGVVDASVDYDGEKGLVIYDPKKISKDEIIHAIIPYTATITKDVLFNKTKN